MPAARTALLGTAALLLVSSSWSSGADADSATGDKKHGASDDYDASIADDDLVLLELLEDYDEDVHGPCVNGSCPFSWDEMSQPECGIWLGPSPIKQKEEHGFGFGMFTGKRIPAGTTLESLYMGSDSGDEDEDGPIGEVILPLFGSRSLDMGAHPPLREYVWGEDTMPEIAVEYPDTLTFYFIPAAAAILPCTNKNYNVDLLGDAKYSSGSVRNSATVDTSVHRSRDAAAGSFASRRSAQYVAVRDIAPGEELVCRCGDDDFDGGNYFLNKFKAEKDSIICVDQNVRVGKATSDIDGFHKIGRGLFAKRTMEKDAVIISTPLVPIHRRELNIEDPDDDPVNNKQLMLNYAYGHPNSDLLWLPYGPLVNYLNHGSGKAANAKLRWHEPANKDVKLDRRHEHHHPELFQKSGEEVAITHGKGMTVDVVALRPIQKDEEILIDYGSAWEDAWKNHVAEWRAAVENWKLIDSMEVRLDPNYITAEAFVRNQARGKDTPIRTYSEQAKGNPYPANLETFCYYSINPRDMSVDPTWDDTHDNHDCFRPCEVVARRRSSMASDGTLFRYDVEFEEAHNPRIVTECIIRNDATLRNVPHGAVRIVDRPYTTDVFLRTSFRHEIHLPSDMYPQAWMRKKLRSSASASFSMDVGDEFKRKVNTNTTKGVVDVVGGAAEQVVEATS